MVMHTEVTSDFHKDLNWFNTFLYSYNGVTLYDTKHVHATIALDACLSGLGAVYNDMVYALPIPKVFAITLLYILKC